MFGSFYLFNLFESFAAVPSPFSTSRFPLPSQLSGGG